MGILHGSTKSGGRRLSVRRKTLPRGYGYCATILLADDFKLSRESAVRLLSLCPHLLGWKRHVDWRPLRVAGTSRKSRWIWWALNSSGQLIVVQVNTKPARIRRRLRPKTLRIDYWTLRSSSPRKRKTAVGRGR